MGGNSGMFFGGGLFMWIFWIVLIIIVIAIVKALAGSNTASGTAPDKSPMDILKQRYARGEIDEQEFAHRRRELER